MSAPPPGRRVEPLPPPPGAFDAMLNRAQARRYRRLSAATGVATVFVAGIMGGLAMGGGVSGVQDSIIAIARGGDEASTASPTAEDPSGVARPSESGKPDATHSSPSATETKAPPRRLQVRGRVVDGGGNPVAGLFVYTGTISVKAFVPTSATAAAVTGVRGDYAVPCTGGPVLLTSWELNEPQGLYADGRWAATLVTKLQCGYDEPRKVTEVSAGATVVGHIDLEAGCANAGFPMWLWLGGHRTTAVRLSHLTDGAGFLVSGLPAGTHTLSAKGDHTRVKVRASGTVTQDIAVGCADAPPSSEPPPSLTPEPTPTESETPEPTDSPSPNMPTPTP